MAEYSKIITVINEDCENGGYYGDASFFETKSDF
jgi:hypothetical protein